MQTIFHLAQRDEWTSAVAAGSYFPAEPKGCPFIHFSFQHQLAFVANLIFPGRKDLVLLEAPVDSFGADLRVEANEPGGEAFPHLYRAVRVEEVIRVTEVLPGEDGKWGILVV